MKLKIIVMILLISSLMLTGCNFYNCEDVDMVCNQSIKELQKECENVIVRLGSECKAKISEQYYNGYRQALDDIVERTNNKQVVLITTTDNKTANIIQWQE